MSRGIDIQGIDAVNNFDVPLIPRITFTALAEQAARGAAGQPSTFMGPDEVTPLREIEYLQRR